MNVPSSDPVSDLRRPAPAFLPAPIDAQTRLIALLGFPVEHSLSPAIHNAALAAHQLNLRYVAFRVEPADVEAAVAGLRALHMLGSNVTIPHKQAVVPLMDQLTSAARAVGAVNTIVRQVAADGTVTLRGDNTDVEGFLQPILPHLDRLRGRAAVVFGAGGAARAIVYALLTRAALGRLYLAARRPDQAQALAADFASVDTANALHVVPLAEAAAAVRASLLLVNTTPLGMDPDLDGTPWPEASDFTPGQMAYDLVYNPLQTRFLRDVAAQGATPISGLEMFIGQAAAAYEQWTHRPMPIPVVREVLQAWRRP